MSNLIEIEKLKIGVLAPRLASVPIAYFIKRNHIDAPIILAQIT